MLAARRDHQAQAATLKSQAWVIVESPASPRSVVETAEYPPVSSPALALQDRLALELNPTEARGIPRGVVWTLCVAFCGGFWLIVASFAAHLLR